MYYYLVYIIMLWCIYYFIFKIWYYILFTNTRLSILNGFKISIMSMLVFWKKKIQYALTKTLWNKYLISWFLVHILIHCKDIYLCLLSPSPHEPRWHAQKKNRDGRQKNEKMDWQNAKKKESTSSSESHWYHHSPLQGPEIWGNLEQRRRSVILL